MDFKSFFRPNKSKLLISLLLVVISYLIVFVLFRFISLYDFIHSNPITLLFYNIPFYFTLLVFVLLSYPFGCYISENRAWLKGMLFFLAAFVLISIVLFSVFTGVNKFAFKNNWGFSDIPGSLLLITYNNEGHGSSSKMYFFDDKTIIYISRFGTGCEAYKARSSIDSFNELKSFLVSNVTLNNFYLGDDFSPRFIVFDKDKISVFRSDWNYFSNHIQDKWFYYISSDKPVTSLQNPVKVNCENILLETKNLPDLDRYYTYSIPASELDELGDYSSDLAVLYVDGERFYLFPDSNLYVGSIDSGGIIDISKEYKRIQHRIIISSNGTRVDYESLQKKVENALNSVYVFRVRQENDGYTLIT